MLKRKKPEAEKTETLRGRLPGSFWKKGESKLSQERKDRLFLVSRRPETGVAIIALLTAFFECGGMMLAMAYQGRLGTEGLLQMAAVVLLGLFSTLVLPRILPMDPLIMALTNFLCGLGIIILMTVSPVRGNKQIVYYAIGMGGMMLMQVFILHVKRFHALSFLMMLASIAILALPLLFGEWSNGAKSWVDIPLFGSFQPSELAKVAVIFALAYYFSAHRTLAQMMPAILFSVACLMLLMWQRDLGTALIYYLTTLLLFYIACGNMPLTILGLGGGALAALMGYKMFAHVKVRVAMWRNPWSDPTGKGYQIIQALLAIGSGGLFGVGLGQGTPEKIPEYYNDFIFAVICEQFGQIFGVLLLVVYMILIVRGASVVMRSRKSFHLLLGCGALSMMAIQTFMITAGVIKLVPLTGVTMPFLSYGGSSFLSCMLMIGIVHGIAGCVREDMEEEIAGKGREQY